jgi:hypothetical protein
MFYSYGVLPLPAKAPSYSPLQCPRFAPANEAPETSTAQGLQEKWGFHQFIVKS